MTLAKILAGSISSARYEMLGDAEIEAAKNSISDCLACMIAGASTQTATIARTVATRTKGSGHSTVVGLHDLSDASTAALVNGISGHALDFDDILWTQYGHPSVSVLPAALAVAEATGACGRDLILAYAIGVEVAGKLGRLANPFHYEHGWHATGTIGVFGAAAACAKLLGLNESQTAMALGIAASESSGIRSNVGSMTKPFHAGNAARGGVLAAELAREGFTSDLGALDGNAGWLRVCGVERGPHENYAISNFGNPWELTSPGLVLKRHAACGCTHCAIDGVLELMQTNSILPSEIESIHCHANPLAKLVLCYPRPSTGLEGKFSMEFSLATAAIHGKAGMSQFSDSAVNDASVISLMERITFSERPDLAYAGTLDSVAAEVTLHARGKTFKRLVDVPSGDRRRPLTVQQRQDKFADCVSAALGQSNTQALFSAIDQLDSVRNIRSVLEIVRS